MLDPIALTRRLVDIESITGNEMPVSIVLEGILRELAEPFGGVVERIPVEPNRDNLFCYFGQPLVTLSTHQDTVPPFIPSSEDDEFIPFAGMSIPKAMRLERLGASIIKKSRWQTIRRHDEQTMVGILNLLVAVLLSAR